MTKVFNVNATQVERTQLKVEMTEFEIKAAASNLSSKILVQLLKEKLTEHIKKVLIEEDPDLQSQLSDEPSSAVISVCVDSGNITKEFRYFKGENSKEKSKISPVYTEIVNSLNILSKIE